MKGYGYHGTLTVIQLSHQLTLYYMMPNQCVIYSFKIHSNGKFKIVFRILAWSGLTSSVLCVINNAILQSNITAINH